VKEEVRALFGRWDRREPDIVALWEKSRAWSLEAFDQIYSLLVRNSSHPYLVEINRMR